MATLKIVPDGNGWKVTKGRRTVSNHRKKSAAKRQAQRKANSGDTIQEHGRNGQILNRRTTR